MARNGLGTFTPLYNWTDDRNNNIKILASRMDGQDGDIATALTQSIAVDGQSVITGPIPFASQQITLLAAATTRTGAVNLGQLQDASAGYSSASGTDAFVGALNPVITAYPDGASYNVYFPNTNSGAATTTLDLGGGARNLVTGDTTSLIGAGGISKGMGIIQAHGTVFQYFGTTRGLAHNASDKTSSYVLTKSDVGQYVTVGTGGAITIPDAVFSAGDVVSLFNNTTGNITITCTITTCYISGINVDSNTLTLPTRGLATILFISGTICVVSGPVS